jgi:hypothetical protein
MTFSRSHASMLIKYIGVSFITGAISHGFFSGTRSLYTGLFGVVCFVVGTVLDTGTTNTYKTIILSALLAVCIGSVTGGLQHFPDSPDRSVYILPIGYVLATLLYAYIHDYVLSRREYIYIAISSVGVTLLSVGFYIYLQATHISLDTHLENISAQAIS